MGVVARALKAGKAGRKPSKAQIWLQRIYRKVYQTQKCASTFLSALMHSRVYISHQTLTLVKRLQVKCAFEVCKATSGKPKSFWKQALWADKAQIELSFSVFFLFWGEQLIKRTLLQEICRINETNSWDWIPLNTNNFWMQMSSSQSRNWNWKEAFVFGKDLNLKQTLKPSIND